jgi:hypothetical protein
MPNLRIVSDNAARRSTLTASTTAGLMAVANLLTDKKSDVWRATATSATITGNLAVAEILSTGHLAHCNLSPTTTWSWRLYSGANGTGTLLLNTGSVLACPAPARKPAGWTAAQAASAYAYGGGAHARIWFEPTSAMSYVIDIVDTNNLQGYIEAATLVVGAYWSPTYNATAASMTAEDTTQTYDNAAGDEMADAGTIRRRVPIDLSFMPEVDRAKFVGILMNSRAYPILLSVFPESPDLALERDHAVYGRRTEDSEVAIQFAAAYGSKVTVREI